MADNNIFIRITGQSNMDEVDKELAKSNSILEVLEENMRILNKTEEAMNDHIKKAAASTEQMNQKLRQNTKSYEERRKALQANIDSQKHDIAVLEANAKAANLLSGSNKSATAQIRQMRDAMMEMEEAGLENLQSYEELAVRASQLTDAQGDLQQRIRILASDTMQLDGAMAAGSGLAGAFNTATSAAELLGGETEGLQKAFYKVQATLSVLNGVQEVANALNKDSAFRVVAAANAKKIFTKETKAEASMQAFANKMTKQAATAAKAGAVGTTALAVGMKTLALATIGLIKGMKLLRLAIAGTGIGLLVLAVAGLSAYFSELNDTLGASFPAWDKLKQVVSGVFEVIKGSLSNVGEALVKFVSGDFKGALDAIKKVGDVSAKYELGVAKEVASQAAKVTTELYDLATAANQRAQERYAKSLQDGLRAISLAQNQAKADAQARHASEVDMAAEELKFAQQRAAITQEQNEKALKANQKEVAAAAKLMNAKAAALKAQKAGTQQYLDALNEYNDAQSNYYNAVQKSTDLQQAIDDANQEVIDAGLALRDAVESQQVELNNAKISLMREGADKEIAQINANYDEQLKTLQGNTEQEIALRKALEDKRAKEIQQVRDKNDREAEEIELNHQLAMAQIEAGQAQSPEQKIAALEKQFDAQKDIYDRQEAWLKSQREAGLITENAYQEGILELSRNRIQAEIDLERNKMDVISAAFQEALGQMQKVADMMFEAMSIGIQAEMDALDEMYTTDAAEAAKDEKKKYITQEEYDRKKAELQMKQAKMAKAQALTNIAISTAMAVMQTIAQLGATPWGIAMAAVAGAMGVAQLAIAASKPLAQYAKGRKGGKGEYAIVGEKGAELMYVPEGASIVPHNKIGDQSAWGDYGVPTLSAPELPFISPADTDNTMWRSVSGNIDYDRLGKAVAENIPQQKAVTVNVDRSGITVRNGHDTRTYLNTKYNGSWR